MCENNILFLYYLTKHSNKTAAVKICSSRCLQVAQVLKFHQLLLSEFVRGDITKSKLLLWPFCPTVGKVLSESDQTAPPCGISSLLNMYVNTMESVNVIYTKSVCREPNEIYSASVFFKK